MALTQLGCPTSDRTGIPDGGTGNFAAAEQPEYPVLVEAKETVPGIDGATQHNLYLDQKCAFLEISPDLLKSRPEGLGCPRNYEFEGAN